MNKSKEEVSLLQTQVALLQSQLDDLEETNEDLRLELERANEALRNMATEREDQYGNMIRIEIMKVAELAQNYDLKVRVKHEPLDSGKLDYSKVRPSRLSVSLVDSEDPVWHYLTCDNRGIVSIELVKEKLC